MNDLRTASVGFVCLAVGIVGTWFIFGAKAAQLEKENRVLRQQQWANPANSHSESPVVTREQLIGQWATTVSKTRLGRIELIFELRDDGQVRWHSVQGDQIKAIAEGTWKVEDQQLRFSVIIIDGDNGLTRGAAKTATAHILELSGACLELEVEGDQWGFHRTTI